jgi:hypothetical protein
MSVSIAPSKCKCGNENRVIITKIGAWVACPNRKWYNFWKHDKTTRHAWFPKKV